MEQNKEMAPFPGEFCRREGKSPQNANLRRWQGDSLRKGQPAEQSAAGRQGGAMEGCLFGRNSDPIGCAARGDERAHQAPHRPIKISNEGELSP